MIGKKEMNDLFLYEDPKYESRIIKAANMNGG